MHTAQLWEIITPEVKVTLYLQKEEYIVEECLQAGTMLIPGQVVSGKSGLLSYF
jgi:hypothetical protein